MIPGCWSGSPMMGPRHLPSLGRSACSCGSPLSWCHPPSGGAQGTWPTLSGPLGCWSKATRATQRVCACSHRSASGAALSPTTPGRQRRPPHLKNCRSCFRKQRGLSPNCRGGSTKAATGRSFANKKAEVRSSQVPFQRSLKKPLISPKCCLHRVKMETFICLCPLLSPPHLLLR